MADTEPPVRHLASGVPYTDYRAVFEDSESLRLRGFHAAAFIQPGLRLPCIHHGKMAFSCMGTGTHGVFPGGQSADPPDSAFYVEGQRADGVHGAVYRISYQYLEDEWTVA